MAVPDSPGRIVAYLRLLRVELSPRGDLLWFRPADAVSSGLLGAMAKHRTGIIALLRRDLN